MKEKIISRIRENIAASQKLLNSDLTIIIHITESIVDAIQSGHKLLVCGNGGSAGDAQHIAAEFVNRFYLNRAPYPAIALTTDTSIITSIANDFSYEEIFKKQVEALGQKGDVLLAISTSGNAQNVNAAVKAAKQKKILTIGLTGQKGGTLKEIADIVFQAPAQDTPRIQEVHLFVAHLICELAEEKLACTQK